MKRALVLIAVAVIMIGGYELLNPRKSESNSSANAGTQKSPAQETKTFSLTVLDKKLTSGSPSLQAKQGDTVVINITVNEDEELHLHGYDKSVDLEKDKPAKLTLTADKVGHFPFELEKSSTELGALEVTPQ